MTAQLFFKELKRLIDESPKKPTFTRESEDCDWTNNVLFSKNLTDSFDSQHCSDCISLSDSQFTTTSINCDHIFESEDLYECQGPYKSFNVSYSDNMEYTRDTYYSSNLYGCHDMFGCINLTNKSYCIFNRQLSESEYKQKVAELKKLSPEKIFAVVDELRLRYPVSNSFQHYNENTTYGSHFYYDKNCYMVFNSSWNENCMYLHDSQHNKSSMDMCYGGSDIELGYEIVDSQQCFNCNYLFQSYKCQESSYLLNCRGVKNSLGCVNLQYKEYCILNRQFSKEEYEKLSKQIWEELKKANLRWEDLHY